MNPQLLTNNQSGRSLRRWRAFCTAAAGALLLPGCTVGPNYKEPEIASPGSFDSAGGTAVRSARTSSAWWRSFNDPVLNRLIDQASSNNYEVARAQARLKEARALWLEARYDFTPSVQASGGYDTFKLSRDEAGARTRSGDLYRAGFDATWELDLWGRVRRSVEGARATVESVEATMDDVLVSVQAEVAANYVDLRGNQAQLEVATRNATNQSETVELASNRLKGGSGTQLDVARARSLMNETLATIPRLKTGEQRAMHRIAVLCGLAPASLNVDLVKVRPLPPLPAKLSITSPGEFLQNRPDVRAAERALAAATAHIGVQTAELFPRVTFRGSIGVASDSAGGLSSGGAGGRSFGPGITWAAFDIGRVRQRIAAADARAQQALAVYHQTVLLALEEAENALVALGRERQRVSFLTEAERAATEAVGLARQRYRDGIDDNLSVLDAERTLLNLQDQLANARTLAANRLVAVYKAFSAGQGAQK